MDERQAVFRKTAVDRLSAPDELTEALSITRPSDWLILIALTLIIAGALSWAIVARIPRTVHGTGILESSNDGLGAILFVSQTTRDPIRPGLEVRLTSQAFPSQEYGFVRGVVTDAATSPMNDDDLRRTLGQNALAALCIARDRRVSVQVRIPAGRTIPHQLSSGTAIEGEVVLREERPLTAALPWLQNLWRE